MAYYVIVDAPRKILYNLNIFIWQAMALISVNNIKNLQNSNFELSNFSFQDRITKVLTFIK